MSRGDSSRHREIFGLDWVISPAASAICVNTSSFSMRVGSTLTGARSWCWRSVTSSSARERRPASRVSGIGGLGIQDHQLVHNNLRPAASDHNTPEILGRRRTGTTLKAQLHQTQELPFVQVRPLTDDLAETGVKAGQPVPGSERERLADGWAHDRGAGSDA